MSDVGRIAMDSRLTPDVYPGRRLTPARTPRTLPHHMTLHSTIAAAPSCATLAGRMMMRCPDANA